MNLGKRRSACRSQGHGLRPVARRTLLSQATACDGLYGTSLRISMEARKLASAKLSQGPVKSEPAQLMGKISAGPGPRRLWTNRNRQGRGCSQVGIMGISRLGKTVLWAGANIRDRPVIQVLGEGGNPYRRNYGELVNHLKVLFGNSSAPTIKLGDHRKMPMDSHLLVALMALAPCCCRPRQDFWSIPKRISWLPWQQSGLQATGRQASARPVPGAGRILQGMPSIYMHSAATEHPSDWDVSFIPERQPEMITKPRAAGRDQKRSGCR